jgi:hypothetical protein
MRPRADSPVLTALAVPGEHKISDISPGVDTSVDVCVDVHSSRWAT